MKCKACDGKGYTAFPSGSLDCGNCLGTGQIEVEPVIINRACPTDCHGTQDGETLTIDKVIPCYTLDDGDSLMIVFKGRPSTRFHPGDEIIVQKK